MKAQQCAAEIEKPGEIDSNHKCVADIDGAENLKDAISGNISLITEPLELISAAVGPLFAFSADPSCFPRCVIFEAKRSEISLMRFEFAGTFTGRVFGLKLSGAADGR